MIGKSSLRSLAASLAVMGSALSLPVMDSSVIGSPTPMRVRRQSKARGNRFQRQVYGNKPGRYRPHQGAREMARRVRNIALGRYNKGQLA
jgi:hypothetical protein